MDKLRSWDRKVTADMAAGLVVERDAAPLPQTDQQPLFVITGGLVAILGIVGEVTEAIEDEENEVKLVAAPDIGTDVDICSVLDVADLPAGTLLGITGTFSDPLTIGTVLAGNAVVVNSGTIDVSTTASTTGAVKWQLRWFPLSTGANILPAEPEA